MKLWGLSNSDKCRLCGRQETTNHILSSCPIALEQGRYTYRHNQILKIITENIDTSNETIAFYSDLEGLSIGGGTIPPDVLVTGEKPDIVIIDRYLKRLIIIELTCPWEDRFKAAREHKTEKYTPLVNDIQNNGFSVEFIPLEIGVRGIINKDNKESIKDISEFTKINAKALTKELSKQAVISSYFIFLNRNERDWNNNVT